MNERIKELAKQSGLIQYDTDSKLVEVKKFAELIIEECASLFPITFTDEPYSRRIDKTIRKHFGIVD